MWSSRTYCIIVLVAYLLTLQGLQSLNSTTAYLEKIKQSTVASAAELNAVNQTMIATDDSATMKEPQIQQQENGSLRVDLQRNATTVQMATNKTTLLMAMRSKNKATVSTKQAVVCTPSCNCTNNLQFFSRRDNKTVSEQWTLGKLYHMERWNSDQTDDGVFVDERTIRQQHVLLPVNNDTEHQAVCVWNGTKLNTHLPHWLEIMYKCWSWWALHTNATTNNDTHIAVVLEMTTNQSHSYWKDALARAPLAQGLWTRMQDALNVQVVLAESSQQVTSFLPSKSNASTAAPPAGTTPTTMIPAEAPTGSTGRRRREQLRATPRTPRRFTMDSDLAMPWFANTETAYALRKHVVQRTFPGRPLSGCNCSTENDGSAQHHKNVLNSTPSSSASYLHARIGVLDRIGKRHLMNHEEIVDALRPLVSTPVVYQLFEEASFEDQIDFYSSIDILVSPHGAQLSGAPFMPTCGAVLELLPRAFPYQYYFGSLTASSNLTASFLYLSDGDPLDEMKNISTDYELRKKIRNGQLCPPVSSIVSSVRVLLDKWESCCSCFSSSDASSTQRQ